MTTVNIPDERLARFADLVHIFGAGTEYTADYASYASYASYGLQVSNNFMGSTCSWAWLHVSDSEDFSSCKLAYHRRLRQNDHWRYSL